MLHSGMPIWGIRYKLSTHETRKAHLRYRIESVGVKKLAVESGKDRLGNHQMKLQRLDRRVPTNSFEPKATCGLMLSRFCSGCFNEFKTPSKVENLCVTRMAM